MEYISVKAAADNWGVSPRQVQRLLQAGRISGAKKYGNYWQIPAHTLKPEDPRKEQSHPLRSSSSYIFFSSAPLPKENPDAVLAELTGGVRALAAADLAFRRGDFQPAKDLWQNTGTSHPLKLSTASLATAAAISSGDYGFYYAVKHDLEAHTAAASKKSDLMLLSLPDTLASVSMALPHLAPKWLDDCDFSMLPPQLRPFLLYLYAMHQRNIGDMAAQLSTARAAVILCEEKQTFTWLDVYLLLLCASASFGLGNEKQAERYLLAAMDLGLPHGFIMPFADNFAHLGGLMEGCLDRHYPECKSAIVDQWESSFKNWISFHNEFSKANITTLLNAQEYHIALLLAKGETYASISRHMNLSVGRIKNIISQIYSKLHINKRSELSGLIL